MLFAVHSLSLFKTHACPKSKTERRVERWCVRTTARYPRTRRAPSPPPRLLRELRNVTHVPSPSHMKTSLGGNDHEGA